MMWQNFCDWSIKINHSYCLKLFKKEANKWKKKLDICTLETRTIITFTIMTFIIFCFLPSSYIFSDYQWKPKSLKCSSVSHLHILKFKYNALKEEKISKNLVE